MTVFHVKQHSVFINFAGADLSDKTMDALHFYADSLLKWNQKVNLVSRKTEDRIFADHIIPSLAYGMFVERGLSHIDVGSGAGLPGLILKIIFPDLKIDLVDSNRKKILFCRYIIAELELSGISARLSRVEDIDPAYDVAVFRSVAPLERLSAMASRVLKSNGYFLSLKGRREPVTLKAGTVQTLSIPEELKRLTPRLADSVIIKVKPFS